MCRGQSQGPPCTNIDEITAGAMMMVENFELFRKGWTYHFGYTCNDCINCGDLDYEWGELQYDNWQETCTSELEEEYCNSDNFLEDCCYETVFKEPCPDDGDLPHICGITGCTDPEACNYDETATADDGSCEYEIDCAGTCGGDLEPDCCGACGGDNSQCSNCCGIPFNEDCTSDCYEDYNTGECCLISEVDECGVCYGDGIADGECDCYGNVLDCSGECGGDNSSCNGCTNPYATNFDSEATNDNGSCEYYAEGVIDEHELNQGIPMVICYYGYIFSPVGEYIELFTALNYNNISVPILNFTNNTEEYQFSITFGITEVQCFNLMTGTYYMLPAINIIDYETGWSQVLVGDINGDGEINVIDIVMVVDLILYNNYDVVGDVNEDGSLDVLDIVMLVDWVLNGMPEADSDGDGVIDVDDSDPNNSYQCSDLDGDTCDDCSTGHFNPSDDGFDYDGDGQCDDGDCDDDNDGCQECWDYCY